MKWVPGVSCGCDTAAGQSPGSSVWPHDAFPLTQTVAVSHPSMFIHTHWPTTLFTIDVCPDSLAPHLLQIRLSLPVLSCTQHSYSTACCHLPLWALRNLTSCLPHRLALRRTDHPPPLLALVQNCTLSDKIWIPLGKGHFVFYGKSPSAFKYNIQHWKTQC